MFPAALLLSALLGVSPGADSIHTKQFAVEFVQDGAVVPITDGTVTLKKEALVIRVSLFKGQEGITVSASEGRYYYDAGTDGAIPDYDNIAPKTMVEPSFNADHELLVDSEQVCYWFYTPKSTDWHRFDKDVIVKHGVVTATKSIDSLFIVETKRTIPVAEVTEPLYFFFLAQAPASKGKPVKELSRGRVVVRWQ